MKTGTGLKNKVQGKTKQIKGSINQKRGKGLKGGMQKIEGKIQEKLGDMEMKSDSKRIKNKANHN